MQSVDVCLDVNQSGTNHNCYTQTLDILPCTQPLMNPDSTPKTRSVWPTLLVKIAGRENGCKYALSSQLSFTANGLLVIIIMTAITQWTLRVFDLTYPRPISFHSCRVSKRLVNNLLTDWLCDCMENIPVQWRWKLLRGSIHRKMIKSDLAKSENELAIYKDS